MAAEDVQGSTGPKRRRRKTAKTDPAAAPEAEATAAPISRATSSPGAESTPAGASRPVEPRRGTDPIAVILWVVAALVTVGGGIMLAYPFWGPLLNGAGETAPMARSEQESAFGDLVRRLEELVKARAGTEAAIREMEAERRRAGGEIRELVGRMSALEEGLAQVGRVARDAASAPPAADAKAVDDVAERVSRLERHDALLEGVKERLGDLESAIKSETRARATAVDLAPSIAELRARLDTIEQSRAQARAGGSRAEAMVLAVGQLREALRGAGAFQRELATVAALADASPEVAEALAKLRPHAGLGVPTLTILRDRFDAVAAKAGRATLVVAGEGWIERAFNRLASLVSVRRTVVDEDGGGADAGVAARLGSAEAALRRGDLAAAVAEVERLTAAPARAAAAWLAEARARLDVEQAAAVLYVHAISKLAPATGGPPE